MNKAIEQMVDEHRLIVRVLGALDCMSGKLAEGGRVPREDVGRFATFFREFADRCHHGKEEDRLFVKMNEQGFPREYGPVGVMLSEHEAGRAHVRALAAVGQGIGPLTTEEAESVQAHANEFVPLLLQHIQKEDHVLYPMALQALPPGKLASLEQECEEFDREVMKPGQVDVLKALAGDLIAAYPADESRLMAFSACTGCAGHGP
jgi:hemerythrin-like domain-containing protein